MVKSKFRLKRIVSLIIEIWFYSAVTYAVAIMLGIQEFSKMSLVKAIFPIITGQYWFMTTYVGVYVLTPFINKFLNSLEKKEFKRLLIILFIILSLIKTIYPITTNFEANNGYGLTWLIYLYLVGAYIRLYPSDIKMKNCFAFFVYLLMIAINIVIKVVLTKSEFILKNNYIQITLAYNTIFTFIESVAMFIIFKNIKIKNCVINDLIRFISPLTLAVYLIHESPWLKQTLWGMVAPYRYIGTNKIYLSAIISIFLIFISCCIIELVRKGSFNLISKIPIVKKIAEKI